MKCKMPSKSYSFQSRAGRLLNDQTVADVCFLVGHDRTKIYANRSILSVGSDVFRQMLFGELKESAFEIEISDCSAVGLMTVFRYIYGFDLDFDLEHLHQTFTAGDKYLVHHFTDAVLEYTKNKLDVSNCCMVYDQVLKLPQRTPLLRQAAKLIQEHSREAFRSAYFIRIDQHTLISMLKLPKLNVKEIDILRFCSQWVDAQASWCGLPASKENRQAIFEPIKYFIRFDVITDIDKVKDLLLESDFIHFTGKFGASKKVAVKCLTKRRAFNAKTNRTKANESRLKQPTENQVSIQIDLNQPDAIQPNLATNESTLFSEILVDMCKVAIFVLILVCMALFLLVCASSISHPKRSDAFIPF